jgi:hypothetical protein
MQEGLPHSWKCQASTKSWPVEAQAGDPNDTYASQAREEPQRWLLCDNGSSLLTGMDSR